MDKELDKKIKQIANQVFDQRNTTNQYSTFNVPNHTHNGTDSPRINLGNAVLNNKYTTFIEVTAGTNIENQGILDRILNPSTVYFHGIAYTPASGTVTTKVSVSGMAQLGNIFQLAGDGGAIHNTINIAQTNSSTVFNKVGTAWVPLVTADSQYLAGIYNGSGSLVGYISVVAFTGNSITIQAPLDADWIIKGSITIS